MIALSWCFGVCTDGVELPAPWIDRENDARLKLEEEYGEGTVFDLHNEIDASMPR
jgi:hypothetical protein